MSEGLSGVQTISQQEGGGAEPRAAASGEIVAESQRQKAGASTLENVGAGLPSLPKKLIEKIKAGEYIDFASPRAMPQAFEGQMVVVQVAGLGAVHENDPGPGYVVPVFCRVCGCAGKRTPRTLSLWSGTNRNKFHLCTTR